ncbi:MAG TPA: GntR family transcriptional regulator [Aestuariivirgaceae bacterium]|jgi:DNA-binding GntR family transcriptional regulator
MELEAKSYFFLDKVRGPRGGATTRVFDALREAIVSLELPPGAPIDKAALCERLGVSRYPVSEALLRLQAEGLVEIQPQRGSSVALIRLADAEENMFLRSALEAAAMRALAPVITAETIAALQRNIRYQKAAVRADDRAGFYKLDLEFHEILLDALKFPRVKAAVENARLALERIRRLLASARRHAVTLKEHQRIVCALEAGDGERAASAMIRHLDAVNRELKARARAQPELFADREAWTAKRK